MDNKKEYLLDLYEVELHKKSLYEEDFYSNAPKPNRENEFAVAVKNVKILEELLDLLENE